MKKTLLPFPLLALMAQSTLAMTTPIVGVARNGSDANKPLANAEVQLIRPANPAKKIERATLATTQTDASGRFSFPARKYSSDDLLMANVSQGGFDYPVVAFDGGQKLKQVGINVNPKKVELLVFDTTTDPVPLDYQVHHLAISKTKTGIKCIERIVVHNHSPSTLLGVGPRQISLLLDIPKAAKNVTLDPKVINASPGAKIVQTKDGWGVVRPITPDAYGAQNAIIISYNMDWPSQLPWAKTIDLSRKTIYPTKFFFVARTTEDKELQVTAPKLSADQEAPVPVNGENEVRLVNSLGAPMMPQGGAPPALAADADLEIRVSRPVSATFWGFAAMTLALCLFLPVAMIKPRRKNSEKNRAGHRGGNFAEPRRKALVIEQSSRAGLLGASGNEPIPHLALGDTSRDLIQKIADLDDRFEAGQVLESEYQTQRAAWKTQLLESLNESQSAAN